MEFVQGALEPIQAITSSMSLNEATTTPAVQPQGFGQWFVDEMQSLNTQMVSAETGVQQLAAGTAGNLHNVMLQIEQSRLAFQLAVQVHGKVLEAYQEIMRMQV
jgi:flagellar hook-basal body complex protein FliE